MSTVKTYVNPKLVKAIKKALTSGYTPPPPPEPLVGGSFEIHRIMDVADVSIEEYPPIHDFDLAANGSDYKVIAGLLRTRNKAKTGGRPMRRGPVVSRTHLSRIATDGKIFTQPETYSRFKDEFPEVILVGDASGSMGSTYKVQIKAMYHMFIALAKAGVEVTAAVHTARLVRMKYEPIVVEIAKSKDGRFSTTAVQEAFRRAVNVNLHENFDGICMEHIAKKFSLSPKKKVMIWMSDGAPAGGGAYAGKMAADHTTGMVEKLSDKEGIIFIGVSLAKWVVDYNERLFGPNHVDASGGLEPVRKEIHRIIKEKSR